MDQYSKKGSDIPVDTVSPEEDAILLAIEALEARSVDPDPRPLNAPREVAVPPRPAPVAPPMPVKVIEPVIPVPTPVLRPITPPQPAPIIIKEAPKPIALPPKPVTPVTPAEAIADALAHAPATKGFQFFLNQHAPRKPFIIIGAVVIVIAVGVGAYLILR
jgi:hypothetical protein